MSVDPVIAPPESVAGPCAACGRAGRRVFFSLPRIPIQSNLMLETPDEAIGIEHRPLRLATCPTCAYIANVDFDPGTQELSERYEVTQGFSPTFSGFLGQLAQDLVNRLDMRGRRVVEIGCGAGEFLAALCSLGDNIGWGIDPATDPSRLPTDVGDRLTLLSERWSPDRHRVLDADVVCCRHTLEHIADPLAFLRSIRAGIRDDTSVVFEVPDATRILTEGAFWDIYYEHGGYWLPDALQRVFNAAGFVVESLEQVFRDQYLLLIARPGETMPSPATTDTENAVAAFCDAVGRRVRRWRERLRSVASSGGRAVVWGSGSKAVGFLTTLGDWGVVSHIVDVNPYRSGARSPGTGHEIIEPRRLPEVDPSLVIVMNPAYDAEIRADLARLGISPEVRTVLQP